MIMRPVKKTVGRNIFFETVGIVLFCCPENAFGVHLTLTLVSVVLALLELIYVWAECHHQFTLPKTKVSFQEKTSLKIRKIRTKMRCRKDSTNVLTFDQKCLRYFINVVRHLINVLRHLINVWWDGVKDRPKRKDRWGGLRNHRSGSERQRVF